MSKKTGIVERVKAVTSIGDLMHLELEVKGYDFISAQTLARFRRAVAKRSKELRNETLNN